MDVAIVLDMSGSNAEIFDAMFDFTRMLTLGLPVGFGSTRVAVVRYSDTANVSFYLDKYSDSEQVTSSEVIGTNIPFQGRSWPGILLGDLAKFWYLGLALISGKYCVQLFTRSDDY